MPPVSPKVTLDAIEAGQVAHRGRTVTIAPVASSHSRKFSSWKFNLIAKLTSDPRLKPDSYTRVGVALTFFINSVTYDAFPSHKAIAAKATVSIATVKKAVSMLERLGYLKIGKRGRKNLYRFPRDLLLIDEIEKMQFD